jgi:hypothetical protein
MFDFIKKFIKKKEEKPKAEKPAPIYTPPELPKPLPVKRDPAEIRFDYYKAKLRRKRKIRNRIARKSRRMNYS